MKYYRNLRGPDKKGKCALNVIMHTFQADSALLTTKSVVNKALICPHA